MKRLKELDMIQPSLLKFSIGEQYVMQTGARLAMSAANCSLRTSQGSIFSVSVTPPLTKTAIA